MKQLLTLSTGMVLALAGGPTLLAAQDSAEVTAPELLRPLSLTIPQNIEHVVEESDMATVLMRVDSTGRVVDWIPLELPHYGLTNALDASFGEAVFKPATRDGKPVSADLTARINVGQGGRIGVQSVSVVDWVNTRLSYMGLRPERLYLSSTDDLDRPLRVVRRGEAKAVKSETGDVLTGQVWVEFFVDQFGHPRLINPEESGRPALEQAALLAVRDFRFEPPRSHGVPTVVKARIMIVFS